MKTVFGFDLAPSNIDLAGAEVELRQALAQESVLKRRLEPILDRTTTSSSTPHRAWGC